MIPASFVAYDTAGNVYTILTGPTANANMPARSLAVRSGLKTDDGQTVNRLEKGKYEVLVERRGSITSLFHKDRIIVTTNDPDAP